MSVTVSPLSGRLIPKHPGTFILSPKWVINGMSLNIAGVIAVLT
jgi:hypothetical protein